MTKLCTMLGMICLATAALADEPAKAEAKPATKKMAKAPVMMTAADMKWADMPVKGVQGARLWGDMNKGAFGSLIKFAAGTEVPLHTHSYDFKSVVVSGTLYTGADLASAKDFGPGSYVMQPAGWKHVTGCRAGADCVFVTQANGKFDLKPAGEAKPAERKK